MGELCLAAQTPFRQNLDRGVGADSGSGIGEHAAVHQDAAGDQGLFDSQRRAAGSNEGGQRDESGAVLLGQGGTPWLGPDGTERARRPTSAKRRAALGGTSGIWPCGRETESNLTERHVGSSVRRDHGTSIRDLTRPLMALCTAAPNDRLRPRGPRGTARYRSNERGLSAPPQGRYRRAGIRTARSPKGRD